MEVQRTIPVQALWDRMWLMGWRPPADLKPKVDLVPVGINGLPPSPRNPMDGESLLFLPADDRPRVPAKVLGDGIPSVQPVVYRAPIAIADRHPNPWSKTESEDIMRRKPRIHRDNVKKSQFQSNLGACKRVASGPSLHKGFLNVSGPRCFARPATPRGARDREDLAAGPVRNRGHIGCLAGGSGVRGTRNRPIWFTAVSVLSCLLMACGGGGGGNGGSGTGGGGGGGGSPSTITSVTVTCTRPVQTGQTSQCAATISGTGSQLRRCGIGRWMRVRSPALDYTPPPATVPSSGKSTITATSTQDSTKSGSAAVTVTAAPSTITSVTVTCSPTSVQSSQTSQCSATVSGTGSYDFAVNWSVDSGTISSSGLYTAPATAPSSGKSTITATSTQDSTKSGTAIVTVAASSSTITSVAVACTPTSIQYRQHQPMLGHGVRYRQLQLRGHVDG